jgi:hypothetical protein
MPVWRLFGPRLLIGFAVLGAILSPAIAQSSDPFQSAPGPVAAPLKPAPQPRPTQPRERVIIERAPVIERVLVPTPAPARPEPLAPAPAPTVAPVMASDAVRQFAAARGIPLPGDLRIQRVSAGSAPDNGLIGVWGGEVGERGRQLVIGVEGLDSLGRAIVVHAYSGPTPRTWEQNPANWRRIAAQVQGNTLNWTYQNGHKFKLSLINQNQAFLETSQGERHASGYFSRLQ